MRRADIWSWDQCTRSVCLSRPAPVYHHDRFSESHCELLLQKGKLNKQRAFSAYMTSVFPMSEDIARLRAAYPAPQSTALPALSAAQLKRQTGTAAALPEVRTMRHNGSIPSILSVRSQDALVASQSQSEPSPLLALQVLRAGALPASEEAFPVAPDGFIANSVVWAALQQHGIEAPAPVDIPWRPQALSEDQLNAKVRQPCPEAGKRSSFEGFSDSLLLSGYLNMCSLAHSLACLSSRAERAR